MTVVSFLVNHPSSRFSQDIPPMKLSAPFQLIPQYRDYLWGGQRLRPGLPTAEAWVVYEHDQIASGPFAGRTLAEAAAQDAIGLLGAHTVTRTGARFPLLIKILDCAQWLSLQVHPDDAAAERLEGPGCFGKTEAWHVLDAAPDAQLIAGMRPGTTAEALAAAIRDGTILDFVQYQAVQAGDTVFMPARTIHALGPGLLIYEVQQTSDLTYRVFDWNRPATPGRVLHIEKSLAVADPSAAAPARPAPALVAGEEAELVACPYFTLDLIVGREQAIAGDTAGQTFHALTVIEGAAEVVARDGALRLNRFDSAVIPAACGAYEIRPLDGCRVLKASTV
jgi:mannose-6-phosphate isomerase